MAKAEMARQPDQGPEPAIDWSKTLKTSVDDAKNRARPRGRDVDFAIEQNDMREANLRQGHLGISDKKEFIRREKAKNEALSKSRQEKGNDSQLAKGKKGFKKNEVILQPIGGAEKLKAAVNQEKAAQKLQPEQKPETPNDLDLICPEAQGGEAAWAGEINVVAPGNLLALIHHLKGQQVLRAPIPKMVEDFSSTLDLRDIKGQESAKRALEIAAAGGHNLLMIGPPGFGKSMLAQRLPGLLPPLSPAEALEVTMIHSLAGNLAEGRLLRQRPFRDPHHSASLPALVGGGLRARPGEISLAHLGVLFLDEFQYFLFLLLRNGILRSHFLLFRMFLI